MAERPRRRPADRLTSVMWGLLVAAVGTVSLTELSGKSVDLELIGIVGLAVLGAWLVLSAMFANRTHRDFPPAPSPDSPGLDR